MSSSYDGKDYEHLVYSIYRSLCEDERFTEVKHNQKLPGPDGDRQIDVLVTHLHAGTNYVTVIECRDFQRKLTVTHIDAFASKLLDVNANKGIMISRKGFSNTARQKAKRLGIELCTVDIATSLLKELVVDIPIVLAVFELSIDVKFLAKNMSNKAIKLVSQNTTTINDTPLRKLIIDDIRSGKVILPDQKQTIEWSTTILQPPYFIRTADGEKLEIEWFFVEVLILPTYLYGRTDDLPDFVSHVQDDNSQLRIFMPPNFRVGLNSSFVRFDRKSDIPAAATGAIPCIIIPDLDNTTISSKALIIKPT